MTREIEFRAWDKVNSVIVKDFLSFAEEQIFQQIWNPRKWDNFVLMQYTWLKDKNGVKIYEWDIIKVTGSRYGDYIVPITYNDDEWYFATDNVKAKQLKNPDNRDKEHDKVESYWFMLNPKSQILWGYNNTWGEWSTIEVIGNIYENSSLLSKDTDDK